LPTIQPSHCAARFVSQQLFIPSMARRLCGTAYLEGNDIHRCHLARRPKHYSRTRYDWGAIPYETWFLVMSAAHESRLIRNRYWILSLLASGGMGETYRVWDIQERLPAVIKMPRRVGQGAEAIQRRFVQELHAMLALKHDHIVPITDYGDDDERPYVVMRFLPGGSLADYRDASAGAQRNNSVSMLHCWLPGIAAALDFMHGHSVLHRDVKPANIFFDAFLKAYLGDFGIAKALDDSGGMLSGEDLTADNIAVGTAAYMAPEQFRRGTAVTPRTDQYSLAVTVYEMISGSKPFRGDREHIGVEHCTVPPPPLDIVGLRIPPTLQTAVERALAKRPEHRFETCTAFARVALAEVPPLRLETGSARFLCPSCRTIIRLDASRAGTAGMCKQCRGVLEVASDLSALWLRDEQSGAEIESQAASAGTENQTGSGWSWERGAAKLRRSLVIWLGGLLSVGAVAVLAAGCGGAIAWVANEARWRSRFASDLVDSGNKVERANQEIATLRLQLQDCRDKAAKDKRNPGRENVAPGPRPEVSQSDALVDDEDDRGLPTAR